MFLQLMQLAQCHRQCWKRSIDVSQVGGEHTEQIRFCMSWAVCSRVLISVFHFCALINISWMKMAGAKAEDLSARPICKVNFCAIRCVCRISAAQFLQLTAGQVLYICPLSPLSISWKPLFCITRVVSQMAAVQFCNIDCLLYFPLCEAFLANFSLDTRGWYFFKNLL